MPKNKFLLASLLLAVLPVFLSTSSVAETRPGIYILRFDAPPLARAGSGTGLDAMRSAANARKLDARRPASRAYLDALDRIHADRLAAVAGRIGRRPEVVFRYRAVVDGLAVRLTAAEAARARTLPGVRSVTADEILPLHTDAGPAWIGAPALWDGSASVTLPATRGEGVVVGVIDSGINMDHPSFSATPPDGHVYSNPFGAGSFAGWCDPAHPDYDPAYVCNDKLIGAWDFVEAVSPEADGPEDDYFHGSHVASIAAGNALDWPAISGVAPHANVIAYDVCYTVSFGQEGCPASAVTAAIDQAVLDGVDVINLSLGGGADPWNDVDAALLDAVAAGVFVAASAGNDGPTPGTTGHRGPWVATVAASTHDRLVNENRLVDLTGGGSLPPGDLTGRSLGPGYGPAPIVYRDDCTSPFPAGTFPQDEIVVCDLLNLVRRLSYCENVATGGAGGCVLANVAGGPAFVIADFHAVPAIHLDQTAGDALRV